MLKAIVKESPLHGNGSTSYSLMKSSDVRELLKFPTIVLALTAGIIAGEESLQETDSLVNNYFDLNADEIEETTGKLFKWASLAMNDDAPHLEELGIGALPHEVILFSFLNRILAWHMRKGTELKSISWPRISVDELKWLPEDEWTLLRLADFWHQMFLFPIREWIQVNNKKLLSGMTDIESVISDAYGFSRIATKDKEVGPGETIKLIRYVELEQIPRHSSWPRYKITHRIFETEKIQFIFFPQWDPSIPFRDVIGDLLFKTAAVITSRVRQACSAWQEFFGSTGEVAIKHGPDKIMGWVNKFTTDKEVLDFVLQQRVFISTVTTLDIEIPTESVKRSCNNLSKLWESFIPQKYKDIFIEGESEVTTLFKAIRSIKGKKREKALITYFDEHSSNFNQVTRDMAEHIAHVFATDASNGNRNARQYVVGQLTSRYHKNWSVDHILRSIRPRQHSKN